MKYSSKKDLLADIDLQHQKLSQQFEGLAHAERYRKGVWGDDWSFKDLMIHMTVWEQMLLTWYHQGLEDGDPELPAPGYKWNETPRLNREIQKKYARQSWNDSKKSFDSSFAEVRRIVSAMSEKELFEVGIYRWTRKNKLIAYVSANTASHYRTALKFFDRYRKKTATS